MLGNNATGGAANSFGGSSSIIDITAGELQVASDQALGNSGNVVRLSANSATQGFRAAGTFSTRHVFNINAATVGIDVTGGNAFTLNSPFAFGAGGTTNSLVKNNDGVLIFGTSATNTSWNSGVSLANSSTTNGNATVTVSSTSGLAAGMFVNGPGIGFGTVISSITNGTTLVLSGNVGATSTTSTLFFGGLEINAGAVQNYGKHQPWDHRGLG